jgi:hypothetical protein
MADVDKGPRTFNSRKNLSVVVVTGFL